MTWLIFALGAVLAVAGATSIASGIPYMPVEWGWTEVIAGATALSGGIVTFGLGAVVYRLAALQKIIQRDGYTLSSGSADEGSVLAPHDSEDPGVGLEADQPAPEQLDTATFGRRETNAADRKPEPPMDGAIADAAMAAVEVDADQRSEPGPQVEAEATRRVAWTSKLRAHFRKPEDQAHGVPVPEPEPPLEPASMFDHAAPADSAPGFDLDDHATASSELRGDERGRLLDTMHAGSSRSSPETQTRSLENGGSFGRVERDDVSSGPTIVGRYEAGNASYVLLSDGAIEVETETGVHHFASMQELKAFIETQQPHSLAPES